MTNRIYGKTKSCYEFYDIHILRNLGRNIGVKDPTALSKMDLIDAIIIAVEERDEEEKNKRVQAESKALSLRNVCFINRKLAEINETVKEIEKYLNSTNN